MIKLKEVIAQIDEVKFSEIENQFIKNKANNFLFLLQSYKNNIISDEVIREKLNITANSLYVLKTRLFDKVQEFITCDLYEDQEKTITLLLKVPEFCLNNPRETVVAYLQNLEKDLKKFDMNNELLIVYSALKKTHLHSDKYSYYSQLYNKQVSLSLSLEKSEEVLGNFCRICAHNDLSKSKDYYEQLIFLKEEIINIHTLCSSRQIEITKNIILLHLAIFCPSDKFTKINVADLIQQTRAIFDELPESLPQKKWGIVLDYLCFEYYYSTNSFQVALEYFNKVNSQFHNFFLYNYIGLVSHFLVSKIKFSYEANLIQDLLNEDRKKVILFDPQDEVFSLSYCIYNSMIYFTQKNYTDAIKLLVDVQNEFVLKNYFHQYVNIKLTLVYFYIVTNELDKASVNLKSITKAIIRKKGLTQSDDYNHLNYLQKTFDLLINKDDTERNVSKQKDNVMLFIANNGKCEFLIHLIPLLKQKYQI